MIFSIAINIDFSIDIADLSRICNGNLDLTYNLELEIGRPKG